MGISCIYVVSKTYHLGLEPGEEFSHFGMVRLHLFYLQDFLLTDINLVIALLILFNIWQCSIVKPDLLPTTVLLNPVAQTFMHVILTVLETDTSFCKSKFILPIATQVILVCPIRFQTFVQQSLLDVFADVGPLVFVGRI